jgi:mRNA (guanine-N7-)-methyltransferase
MNTRNPSTDLQTILTHYITTKDPNNELECRFWLYDRDDSWSKRRITKLDVDRVIGQLKGCGFVLDENRDFYYLRVSPVDTGSAPIRLDVQGLDAIQEYCRTNQIPQETQSLGTWRFTEKKTPPGLDTSMALFDDFNYSVSLKTEVHTSLHVGENKPTVNRWMDCKKIFRLIKRCRFCHPANKSIYVDISVIKTNRKNAAGKPIPTFTLQESNLLTAPPIYEVELEGNNTVLYNVSTVQEIQQLFRPVILRILCALQSTHHPISHPEQDRVLQKYMDLIYKGVKKADAAPATVRPTSNHFLGPSSLTLQIENATPSNRNTIVENYVVTDKADGERKMMFVCPTTGKDDEARVYLIDINMRVVFTGRHVNNKKLHYTLIDGEHVTIDKQGSPINLYLAFDYYFGWMVEAQRVEPIYSYRFYKQPTAAAVEETAAAAEAAKYYRYLLLRDAINEWNASTPAGEGELIVEYKEFIHHTSIHEASRQVLQGAELKPYPTDGLIYTPCQLAVPIQPRPHAFKVSWEKSFKWKPPEYNTIDFFVAVRKNTHNQDYVKTQYQTGTNLASWVDNAAPHKIIELHCGFDARRNRFSNPFATLLAEFKGRGAAAAAANNNSDEYTHSKFQPTCPMITNAYLAYIPLSKNEMDEWVMKTADGDVFTEGTIVEFAYDATGEYDAHPWRWKPLRVRYDKTANLLAGQKEYGNAFHVADSIWHSIHFPLTRAMVETGTGIVQEINTTEVYYEKTNNTVTLQLRKFHNYVKRRLIDAVRNQGNKHLIDYAVGKAGDLNKWILAGYNFVFGIDYSRDNIMNAGDGACTRYLKEKDRTQTPLHGLFVVGDSSKNIRDGSAYEPKSDFLRISTAVLGGSTMPELGSYNSAGRNGFSVSSCQFAIHYFFRNTATFYNFIKNVVENTELGGYFIGTTYDGESVFKMLKPYKKGEGLVLAHKETVYFKLIKKYDAQTWKGDEDSLGHAIDVFQESIGQNIEEYLVHFPFLRSTLGMCGFELVNSVQGMAGTGLFSQLYGEFVTENNRATVAREMTTGEKTISFLNRYFIFKKTNVIDTALLDAKINRTDAKAASAATPKPPFRKIKSGYVIVNPRTLPPAAEVVH